MNLFIWGPWIDAPGLEAGNYQLTECDRQCLGLVGIITQCGWLWREHEQIVLFDSHFTIFRTVSAAGLFQADDYRRPLARIFENNSDLLDDVQLGILTSRVW